MTEQIPLKKCVASALALALLKTNGEITPNDMADLLDDAGLLSRSSTVDLTLSKQLLDPDHFPTVELPDDLLWVWLNDATPPHWAIKGGGLKVVEES